MVQLDFSIVAGFLILFAFMPSMATDDEELVLMYNDLEPFVAKEGDRISGALGDYLTDALSQANVKVIWKSVPWERQLPTLKEKAENVCAVAIF